jgi:hypothetical protein
MGEREKEGQKEGCEGERRSGIWKRGKDLKREGVRVGEGGTEMG